MGFSKQIDRYVVYYMGGHPANQAAEIDLFDVDNDRIGILYFYLKSEFIPKNWMGTHYPGIHYHIDQFRDVLHILQTEEPVHVVYWSDRNQGYIVTGMEKVGEEETPSEGLSG